MYRIIVVPTNSDANIALCYLTKASGEAAQQNIHKMQKGDPDAIMKVSDDMGNLVTIPVSHVSYALFIDVEKAQGFMESTTPAQAQRSSIF